MTKEISERHWALAQWEMHCSRFCIQQIEDTIKACAQGRPVRPFELFELTMLTTPPLGIDYAVTEVARITKEFRDRRKEAWEMSPDEIHARINDERRSWGSLI